MDTWHPESTEQIVRLPPLPARSGAQQPPEPIPPAAQGAPSTPAPTTAAVGGAGTHYQPGADWASRTSAPGWPPDSPAAAELHPSRAFGSGEAAQHYPELGQLQGWSWWWPHRLVLFGHSPDMTFTVYIESEWKASLYEVAPSGKRDSMDASVAELVAEIVGRAGDADG